MKKAIELTKHVGTKGVQVQIAWHIDKKNMLNGSKKVRFLYKPFERKLIFLFFSELSNGDRFWKKYPFKDKS